MLAVVNLVFYSCLVTGFSLSVDVSVLCMDYYRAFPAIFTAVATLLGTTSLLHTYHIPAYLTCTYILCTLCS